MPTISAKSQSILLCVVAVIAVLAGCITGGGDPTSNNVTTTTTTATPSVTQNCNLDSVSSAIANLKLATISRDPCETPLPAETQYGLGLDQNLVLKNPPAALYASLLTRLKSQAGIDPSMQIVVTNDVICNDSMGGGVTAYSVAFIDGKLLDIMNEYATYLALANAHLTSITEPQALDLIVNAHNRAPCLNLPEQVFFRSQLPANLISAADANFDSVAGGMVYHEYGHLWSWAVVDMVRLNAIPYSSFFYYPSKVEDDADFISGALTKKTNHSLALAQRAYDIMTFEYLNRNMGVPSIVTVDTSWQVQFLTANQSYRPLAQRRITVATGYNDF